MENEGLPTFLGTLIAAVVLGAIITAGLIIVAVFLLL